MTASLERRMAAVDGLRGVREEVAVEATARFLDRHPDWIELYGDKARVKGEEDATFHVDFLASSFASGSPEAFGDYARWTAQMLAARGIAGSFLAEAFRDMGRAAKLRLPALAPDIDQRIELAVAAVREPPEDRPDGLAAEAALFCDAALAGGRAAALAVARAALRSSGSLLDVYADVLEASQREVGRRWSTAEITVADEHRATAITQFVLATLYSEMPMERPARGKGLVVGVLGERHQMGANMVADGLESDGWDITFLGTDVPHADVVAAIGSIEPSFVGVSVTLPANVPALVELVRGLHARPAGERARLIVGGRALHGLQRFAHELGAGDPVSDVRAAVNAARKIEQGSSV